MGLLTTAFKTVADWVDAGYPEEVAKRIVSGELPMDEASRMARAAEQGYGDVLYRGHHPQNAPYSDQDMWMSSSPDVAGTYGNSMTSVGEVTPLRTNAENLAEVRGNGVSFNKVTTNSNKLPGLQADPDSKGVHIGTDRIAEAVKTSDSYDGTRFNNIADEFNLGRGAERSDVYNVLGSRPDVNIRHADAAYDPQYKGSNIRGFADPKLLAGTAAGTAGLLGLAASQDADAGVATSLVKLITNKYGDDIAGATDELVRLGGFPESVARRIATGELPMDEASRLKRAHEQGYGEELYHGSTHDFNAFDVSDSTLKDWGRGTYLTDSTLDASKNYAGTHGPDFSYKLGNQTARAKRSGLYEGLSYDEIEAKELGILKGPNDGVIYPVRVQQDGLLKYSGDFPEESWEEIGRIMQKYDIDGGAGVFEKEPSFIGRIIEENADRLTPEEIATLKKYAPQGHTGILDTTTPKRFSEMNAGNHTIMLPGHENKIRSSNAAFDPEYTGKNIMGGLALPVTAGLLAAGQSEDADAMPSLVLKGGIDAVLAAKQLRNKINKERGKGISGEKSVADFIHRNSNYEKGFVDRAKQWDKGLNGESYTIGINSMADELLASTDDPAVMDAIQSWRGRRLDSSRHNKYGRGAQVAAPAGLLSVGANATTPEERGFKSWEEVSRDPTAPLPPPTWGEAMGKAGDNIMMALDAPMSGIQGLARTGYGLLTGEGLDAALNNGANVVNGGVDAGADRLGKWVTNATGDDTLGFYAKWGSLLGAPF